MPPSLTVALPTYNGAAHLAEALRGILSQDGPPFDLLVCDDRSDDDTPAIVAREAADRARLIINPERLGLAGNWNRCVSLAHTPQIALFHQDDLMRPGHLSAHHAAFARNPDLGFVCGAADVIDDQGRPVPESVVGHDLLGPNDRAFPPGAFLNELAARNPVRCSTVTLTKPALEEAGGFDPAYRYAVDWDAWIRIARRHPITWLAAPTVAIRWHPASETHRFKAGSADLEEIAQLQAQLFADDPPLRPKSQPEANRRLARAYLNRAFDAAKGGNPRLARHCLARAMTLSPKLLATLATNPRLAARLAVGTILNQTARPPGR